MQNKYELLCNYYLLHKFAFIGFLAIFGKLRLAYAITIHKSQRSEFPAIVTPLAMQQYMLLQRNLVYTGITRGKKLVVLIGQRKALAMAVKNNRTENRFSGLLARMLAPS